MPVNDYVTGVERSDKRMKERLMDQFVNHDRISRPPNAAYDEGWERIFGKKEPAPDSVDTVTAPVDEDDLAKAMGGGCSACETDAG